MTPLSFLQTKKEWGIFFFFVICIFLLGLGWRYYLFSSIPSTPFELKAQVLAQYKKESKTIFKLKTKSGQIFYTSSKEKLKDLSHREVLLYGKVYKCDFWQSLRSCYFIAYSISLLPRSSSSSIYDFISSQHQNPLIGKLFESLFFASFLPKEFREIASALHISHLIAISGLHLGILAWMVYLLLGKPYGFLQQRFFPYRNRIFDLGVVSSFILLGYMIFIECPPAFLRAYVMSIVSLIFVYSHLRLLSFSFLSVCVLCILALFPALVINIGFWFSVLGVFYIFLFFHYFPYRHQKYQWIKTALGLNTALFFQMLPIVHCFFGNFSLYSILAIPLSMVFPFWFIAMIVLHCLGLGGVGDMFLQWILQIKIPYCEIYTPFWFFMLYLICSLVAIKSKKAYMLSLGIGGAFYIFLAAKMLR